ncbi:MAG: hypothetical protein ACKVVT_12955 [Dehalococcoidia bacterium]
MNPREQTARAMAFFEASDDVATLYAALGEVAPRAKRMVAAFIAKGDEDAIPGPADLRPARQAATKDEALKTLKAASDFSLLQTLARSIGRRIETIEIAASADFPEGVRVAVPETPKYPATGARVEGTVEATGTMLTVLLDSGETWEGPPSLARLAGTA